MMEQLLDYIGILNVLCMIVGIEIGGLLVYRQ